MLAAMRQRVIQGPLLEEKISSRRSEQVGREP
jgi:hypothetical protein